MGLKHWRKNWYRLYVCHVAFAKASKWKMCKHKCCKLESGKIAEWLMHRRRKGCQLTHVMWRLLRPPSQYRWRRTKILLSLVFPRTCQQFVWVPKKNSISFLQADARGKCFRYKVLVVWSKSLSDLLSFRQNIKGKHRVNLLVAKLKGRFLWWLISCVVCPADLDCLPGKPRKFSFDPPGAKSGQSHFLFSCLTVVSSFPALAGTSAGTFWESNTTISYSVRCPLDCKAVVLFGTTISNSLQVNLSMIAINFCIVASHSYNSVLCCMALCVCKHACVFVFSLFLIVSLCFSLPVTRVYCAAFCRLRGSFSWVMCLPRWVLLLVSTQSGSPTQSSWQLGNLTNLCHVSCVLCHVSPSVGVIARQHLFPTTYSCTRVARRRRSALF